MKNCDTFFSSSVAKYLFIFGIVEVSIFPSKFKCKVRCSMNMIQSKILKREKNHHNIFQVNVVELALFRITKIDKVRILTVKKISVILIVNKAPYSLTYTKRASKTLILANIRRIIVFEIRLKTSTRKNTPIVWILSQKFSTLLYWK